MKYARDNVANIDEHPPIDPFHAMWKHAHQMSMQQPDHPASLQALHMCRQMLYAGAANRRRQPARIAPSVQELAQDRSMLKDGVAAAICKYKDPATAMQHLLYCLMREIMVRTPLGCCIQLVFVAVLNVSKFASMLHVVSGPSLRVYVPRWLL